MSKVVPAPGALETQMYPVLCLTIPYTAALCLRSEEWLKHTVPYGIGHPHSGVIYREANVPSKLGVGVEGHIVWPQFGIPSSDREGSTVGHSIARICGQVHEDLLDLSTISQG